MHPHRLQGWEPVSSHEAKANKTIVYSLGSLIAMQRFADKAKELATRTSALLTVDFRRRARGRGLNMSRVTFTPLCLHHRPATRGPANYTARSLVAFDNINVCVREAALAAQTLGASVIRGAAHR